MTVQTAKHDAKSIADWLLHPHVTRGLLAVLLLGLVLAGIYARLIVGPVQVPFLQDTIRSLVNSNLPDGFTAEFEVDGVMMEYGVRPMVVVSPFSITESSSGATVTIESVRVAFAPIQALFGRPAADLILVQPHIQVVQDFRGIRLATLDFAVNEAGESTVRIRANESSPQPLVITEEGIEVGDSVDVELVSDNDWIVLLVNEAEKMLADTDTRFEMGELRQIEIRKASVEVIDQVYRLYRHFENVDIFVQPDGDDVHVDMTSEIGRRSTSADILYSRTARGSSMTGTLSNIDLAVFLPMLDEEDGIFSLKGGSELTLAIEFIEGTGVTYGRFETSIDGTQLVVQDDSFPVFGDTTVVEWAPAISTFTMHPATVNVGNTRATIEGQFALGVDSTFGPTVGLYFKASDIWVNPSDMPPATAPIDSMEVQGWSAGVYGAVGIDRMTMHAGDMAMEGSGRMDFLQRGIGVDLDLKMTNASMDQMKRMWPWVIGGDIRQLFVDRVKRGRVDEANLSFDLDPGVVDIDGFVTDRVPDGGLFIDAVTSDIELAELEGGLSMDVTGQTRMRLEDNAVTIQLAKGAVHAGEDVIDLTDMAVYSTEVLSPTPTFEVSGLVEADISALTSIANREPYRLLEGMDVGIDPADLLGRARVTLIAQVRQEADGQLTGTDYTLNGQVTDFASASPFEGRMISDGNLSLVASQAGFRVQGTASIDGVPTEISINSDEAGAMELTATAVLDAEARRAMGFDFEDYIGGTVRYVARPESDTVLQLAVDLTDASLTIDEIGVNKAVGEPGQVTAAVSQVDGVTSVERLELSFGDVRLAGSMQLSEEAGLIAADFSSFQLTPGDRAAISVEPLDNGYKVAISGEQLDLKPVLSQYLGLSNEAALTRQGTDTGDLQIELDLDLDRALGFYRTTAFNAKFNIAIRGNKLLRADAQAQLGGDKSLSITTNNLPQGRVMTVAVNDFGTLLRFMGTYPRILGGEGSLVLTTNDPNSQDRGEFVIRDFAVVDEQVVAQILGNHQNSRDLIARQNRVDFDRGQAVFIGGGDHITIQEAAIHGDRVGGTLRGTIYTEERRYDLVGTYVPLFGINNMFQQLPIVGRIVGGREGEGLFGVTFKVEGPLDDPQFRINPASLLAPGVFRQMFEFRAEDVPADSGG